MLVLFANVLSDGEPRTWTTRRFICHLQNVFDVMSILNQFVDDGPLLRLLMRIIWIYNSESIWMDIFENTDHN